MKNIEAAVRTATENILEASHIKSGQLFILGLSTSEVMGEKIGKGSSFEVGETIIKTVLSVLEPHGIYLAVGCCEHLNRAVVMPREAAEKYGFLEVAVIPAPHAGGSGATAAYQLMEDPCVVEFVQCHAGMDIGDTFIGMHLKHVAVPVRLPITKIGAAHVTYARTRPKFIGGSRAVYSPAEVR